MCRPIIDVRPSLKCLEGPKVMGGYASTDSGFARFNHVRIPKENMLSGFAQVTDDGQYLPPPHKKIGYGGVSVLLSTAILVFILNDIIQMLYIRSTYLHNDFRSLFLILTSFSQYGVFSRLANCPRLVTDIRS